MSVNAPAVKQPSALSRFVFSNDVVTAGAVMTIVLMMIIPLPPILLDLLITLNIGATVTVLLVAMYITEALQFSVFPSLLLLLTLFRLGISVAATRLILMHGYAGDVIQAFGQFVVGGNVVIGMVMFLVLMVIQFVVITSGAGRVAEVAARFTLDAMPGKQMSIDSELAAGFINEATARARKKAVEQEADFYGAMDGASKFVRGDAVAALIMIAINLVGGILVGVVQQGMDIASAVTTYSLLTVGDGLVSQIPAILVSTATGITVTRSSSTGGTLGSEVVGQLLGNARALNIAGGLLVLLGLIPGLPKIPFFVMAGGVLFGAHQIAKRQQRAAIAAAVKPAELPAAAAAEGDDIINLLSLDAMELEIGFGLVPLVDGDGSNLLSRISLIRRQTATELGLILPTVRVRDNLRLGANDYRVLLRGAVIGKGEVFPTQLLAMNAGIGDVDIPGISTTEPTFGLPATWIPGDQREHAEILGYTVVDPGSVVATHLTELIKQNAPEILDRQQTQKLINNLKVEHPAVVEEVIPALLSVGEVQRVLQALLHERISIRNLSSILESIGNAARSTHDLDALVEQARRGLAQAITQQYMGVDGRIHTLTMAAQLEAALLGTIQRTDDGPTLILAPAVVEAYLRTLASEMESMASRGHQPMLLCSPQLRWPLRRLIERNFANLVLLSYREIASGVDTIVEGTVNIELAAR
ncbi:MAG TPA: flagellar biosynthesis protein FlhA [Chloroflexota bacterium]|nr:flagellar biosynthesis protein FlhA [Chloroflexota bacterium]